MFGFFKRRDASVEPVAPGTRVEEVTFTAREIYAILGDVDLPMFICNTTTLDLLRPAAMRPDDWRRRAVARLASAGIVDDACGPCPELEELLAPLRADGIEISDGKTPGPYASRDERAFCMAGTRERATLVRSTGDGFSRTFTLSDAGPREKWWTHALRSAGFPRVRCAPPAASVPFIEGDSADEGFAEALMRGDLDRVRAFAARWGADPDRLAETSAAIAQDRRDGHLEMRRLRVIDATEGDVEPVHAKTFTLHKLLGGGAWAAEAMVFPSHGFSYTTWIQRRKGIPDGWFTDGALFRSATFCSLDWLADGDPLAHLMSNPPFPEHLTSPWRPSSGD